MNLQAEFSLKSTTVFDPSILFFSIVRKCLTKVKTTNGSSVDAIIEPTATTFTSRGF